MLGIEVGRVERLTMDQKDQKAVVEIRIQEGIKVYDDAIASIKTEGLIGDSISASIPEAPENSSPPAEPLPKRSRLWTSQTSSASMPSER